jgi:hypothetical protein
MRRLRDKMREDLALRAMSENTIVTYLGCVRRFTEHSGRSPGQLGTAEIRAFLLHLTARRVCARTFNVDVGALLFLYRVTLEHPERVAAMPRMRVPMHLPTVLTGRGRADPLRPQERQVPGHGDARVRCGASHQRGVSSAGAGRRRQADASTYALHEPRCSAAMRRVACWAHDGDGDEVVGAGSGMEVERSDGEGVRGGSGVQGVDAGVLGELPTDRHGRWPSRQEA